MNITTTNILDLNGNVVTVPAAKVWDDYLRVWTLFPITSVSGNRHTPRMPQLFDFAAVEAR